MSTSLDWACWYLQQGFFITPVHPGTKKPIPTGWPKLRLTKPDLAHHFPGTRNIGIILGDEHGTADADLDCAEAIITGGLLLPETGMVYGRESAPRSHHIFRCDPAVTSEKYLDPLEPDKDKNTIAELRCQSKDGDKGMQSVCPPSVHPSGEHYRFENGYNQIPANIDAPNLQNAVRQVAASALLARHWPGEKSGRNAAFLSLAGAAARAGWTLSQAQTFNRAIYRVLWGEGADFAQSDAEVKASFEKHAAGTPITARTTLETLISPKVVMVAFGWLGWTLAPMEPTATVETPAKAQTGPRTLAQVHEVFGRWLHLPDKGAVTLALASVAANRLEGDPVWMMLIGPPSSGKTEILDALLGLPDMHSAGTLTEAALLSGVPKKEHASNASGGLLRAIGDFGFLILKDFTSTLSMGREARSQLLSALREIHDGAWTRHFGTDGGKELRWKGKCALIGGCTPVIDEHHGVMAAMGERFLLCRLPDIDAQEQARRALDHVGKEGQMRRELSEAVSGLFNGFQSQPFFLDEPTRNRLSALAAFTARARSAVIRDSYRREVELIPGAERPARLVLALARLLHAMRVIGTGDGEAWRLIATTALDCLPQIRRRVFQCLYHRDKPASTPDVGLAIDYPTTTTRRALEDLAAHGIVSRFKQGEGRSDLWELSLVCRQLVAVETTFPEVLREVKSEGGQG